MDGAGANREQMPIGRLRVLLDRFRSKATLETAPRVRHRPSEPADFASRLLFAGKALVWAERLAHTFSQKKVL
jgi:hypothetical protein